MSENVKDSEKKTTDNMSWNSLSRPSEALARFIRNHSPKSKPLNPDSVRRFLGMTTKEDDEG